MRILVLSYDLDDLGGSGASLRTLIRWLERRNHTVRATSACHGLEEVRAWSCELILAQQWATEEGSRWAAALGIPFVMLVHGPGQFEHFMPQCDLVGFETQTELELARPALGRTPTMVVHPPVLAEFESRLAAIRQAGRRRPTLSLCMTVAHEGQTLEKAIASVAPVVDEIIIGVDTKSTDKTAAIGRSLATRYFEYSETSPPDFPRMRNRALELAETDWAIVLDGHEWIEHAEQIRPALETSAWSIEVQTLYEPDENRVPALAFPFPRIHRRHVRFKGAPAHEEISTPLNRRRMCLDIKVWHERKPGAAAVVRRQEKLGGELDHLRNAWLQFGDRRALFYLANGLREATRFGEAIEAYEDYLKAPNFEEEGWQARLYLARSHLANGAKEKARGLFEQTILQCPGRAEPVVNLGYLLMEVGDLQSAAAWFRMAASLPEPRHCRLFVEVPVYRWGAWHGLALALDRLGDYSGAAAAETRARDGGAGQWAQQNIEWWRSRGRGN